VLDSIGFVDTTGFGRSGFFHTSSMHVVERLARQGNTILYEVTVEDPEVLVEPWVLAPRTSVPNPNPDAGLIVERGNCEIFEDIAEVNQIRHGASCAALCRWMSRRMTTVSSTGRPAIA
jgi:hypothetical protein